MLLFSLSSFETRWSIQNFLFSTAFPSPRRSTVLVYWRRSQSESCRDQGRGISFARGFVATNYAMNSSTVVQMQLKANSIFGDLDVFQSNGPSFKRRLEEWSFLWMLSAVCLYDDYRNSRLEVKVAPLKGHIPLMVVAKSAKYLQY